MLIRIMGCKEREENINKMLSALPDDTEVIWDTDHNPCHTLQRVVDSNEQILIMEDDIELCKDFFNKAMAEIKERPNAFIMFYAGWETEDKDIENKNNWVPYSNKFVFTQAYYLPAWLGKELKEFLETNLRAHHHRRSKSINIFLTRRGIEKYLVTPSLVQHIDSNSLNCPWASVECRFHQSKTYKYE